MRFARFLFALFIGAFIFIALMKLLFFGLMAVVLIGGLSWASRAMSYRRSGGPYAYRDSWQRYHANPYEGSMTTVPMPLDPRWQTGPKVTKAYGHRIDVV